MEEAFDLNKVQGISDELSKGRGLEMAYGAVAFWVTVIRKAESLPDDVSLAEFYGLLNEHHIRIATASVREEIEGKGDAKEA